MTKSTLIWCAVLTCVAGLSGCNCLSPSRCGSDSVCQAPTAYFQKTWASITNPAATSKTIAGSDKKPTTPGANRIAAKADGGTGRTAANIDERRAIVKTSHVGPPIPKARPTINAKPGEDQAVKTASLPDAPFPMAGKAGLPILVRSDNPPPVPAPIASASATSGQVVLKNVSFKYGAAADYKMLVGRVHEWNKTLRLRYAPVEQPEVYGGAVTLEGSADLQQLRDGQHVRVRGTLVPAGDRTSSARFRVDSVEVLD